MEKEKSGRTSIGSMLPGNRSDQAAGLYEAAITGEVDALDALLEQYGEVILHRVSLTSFAETPLHLAALMGHLEFTKRLLKLRPQLTSELDSEKCTPLHLAAANNHTQVVKELLGAYGKACLMQDQEGRVPLHLAAMRGRISVVQELMNSMHGKESVNRKVDDGDSVLHLCVKYNHLDVLKVVLGSIGNDEEVLKMTDSRGYTVLHLAVKLKQIKTVRFLLELPMVRTKLINHLNEMDLDDVLNHSPKDYKILEIREILSAAGFQSARQSLIDLASGGQQIRNIGDGAVDVPLETLGQVPKSWISHMWHWVKRIMDYRGDWMNDTRGSLMMVASIISTVTFQAALSPPGGVWQEDYNVNNDGHPCNVRVCSAGNAVGAYYYSSKYCEFLKYDMISFTASLVVMFLLISGFPLSNKFCLWFLSVAMSITITFFGLTFLSGVWLVVPGHLMEEGYYKFKNPIYYVSLVIMGICGLCLLIRLSSWLRSHKCKAAWSRLLGFRPSLSKLAVNPYAYWKTARADTSRNCC